MNGNVTLYSTRGHTMHNTRGFSEVLENAKSSNRNELHGCKGYHMIDDCVDSVQVNC